MINRIKSRSESRGKSQGFVYKKRDPSTLKARAEQSGGRFDSIFKQGFDTFRPKPGDNLIRFLPPTWEGAEHYAMDVWVHQFIGPDSSTYLCLNKMKGEKCPMCAAAKEAKDAGDKDEAKALGSTKKALAWIVDRDNPADQPSLYLMSWTMDKDITTLCHNKRSGSVLWIDNPDEGYDITIKRTGQGLKTRYSGIAVDRDPSTLDEDEKAQEELLAFAEENPLPTVLQYFPASHLEKVLEGTAESRDDELDEDPAERPARGRRGRDDDDGEDDKKGKGGRRARDEEEDEKPTRRGRGKDKDGDEDPPFDPDEKPRRRRGEEEEDERPASRRRARDDDDGDKDEKDEAPRRRRSEPAEEEEETRPARRRAREEEPAEEEETRPARRRTRADDDEATEEQEEKPRGRRAAPEDEEEDKPRRRASRDEDPDEEADEKPARRRASARDEEEDERPTRRKPREDDGGEEEERPRRAAGRRK